MDDINEKITLAEMRDIINNLDTNGYSPEIIEKRKRVANKFLDMASVNYGQELFIYDNIDNINEDMLDVGEIQGKILKIDISPIMAEIDLSRLIRNSFLERKINFIHMLMSHNIDLFNIEPRIMIMCAETNQDELMSELIDKKIPVYTDQYRCVYKLAADGKLTLIKKIMKNYCFTNVLEIISKISIQAIQNNHVPILKYLLKAEMFYGLPDHMFCMFINSVQYGGHLDVIKFFVDSGISIRQDNYLAVHTAIKFDKTDIIKYFYDKDITVDTILTNEQKEKYGLEKIIMMKQYIGTEQICSMSYDDINEADTYFQCNNNSHYYKSENWIQWRKNISSIRNAGITNLCPLCLAPIKKIMYINAD